MKKTNFPGWVKSAILVLVILLALFFILGYIWKFLVREDYFKVKDVIAREAGVADLSYLKGNNIFTIDLKKEAQYLSDLYPSYSKIRLARVLPDRIFVDFVKRKAVALVKLYRYFAVDQEGIIFSAPEGKQEFDLPIIMGLETKLFGPKPGRRYNIRELNIALEIIKEAKYNKALKNYNIKRIDVGNASSVSVLITFPGNSSAVPAGVEILEVKMAQDNIKEKIIILAGIMAQTASDLANVKYIDLRFKEPVIKLK